MKWFVFTPDYGCVFECDDDTEGKQQVLDFIVSELKAGYNIDPEETDNYWVIRGEEKTFCPPSSKGMLV